MIPADFIAEWRAQAPWTQAAQVEQDLAISRALVEMFRDDEVARAVAFRGGTALFKLHLSPAPRYSEDIDLVQTEPGPIGETLDKMRSRLDPWLGQPRRSFGEGRVTLVYRFDSEDAQPLPLRLKVEINTREHFTVLGLEKWRFEVRSRWFSGSATISTYALDELLGTKMRALYQRKEGRDLFDIWWAARHVELDPDCVVRCFREYLEHEGHRVFRAEFEANLEHKLTDDAFTSDLGPLLAPGTDWNLVEAARWVEDELVARLPREPWKGPGGSGRAREG